MSRQRARQDYGVILESGSNEIAQAATKELRDQMAKARGPVKLIDRGPYAETLMKKGLIKISDQEMECLDCANDEVLDHYWKDLYKYTLRPPGNT